jgi:tripartite-type tricarboxylate transporter receptor subunit TctC
MVAESGSHAIAPNALVGGTRYHPVTDFTHLGVLSTGPLLLVVNNDFPARTAPEVVARLRAAPPGSLNYATSGVGGVLHLATEMLGQELGTRFVHVPYRSGGLMLQSIHTGETQFGIAAIASAFAMVRDGMVRPIAVTGAERFPLYPDVPTLMESGVPGFDIGGWYVLLGPAGIPGPVAATINRALNAALAEEPLRERMLGSGLNPWRGPNGLAEARSFMARELEKHRVIVERTGVRLQP